MQWFRSHPLTGLYLLSSGRGYFVPECCGITINGYHICAFGAIGRSLYVTYAYFYIGEGACIEHPESEYDWSQLMAWALLWQFLCEYRAKLEEYLTRSHKT